MNQSSDESRTAVFHLFGTIGGDEAGRGFDLASIVTQVSSVLSGDETERKAQKLIFLISSRGGSSEESLRIYAYLANLPVEVVTVGVGLVESAAVTVYLAGRQRLATPTTSLIHEGRTSFKGVAISKLVKMAHSCLAYERTTAEIIAKATGDKRKARRWLRSEHLLSSQEAKSAGIVHEISEELFVGSVLL